MAMLRDTLNYLLELPPNALPTEDNPMVLGYEIEGEVQLRILKNRIRFELGVREG